MECTGTLLLIGSFLSTYGKPGSPNLLASVFLLVAFVFILWYVSVRFLRKDKGDVMVSIKDWSEADDLMQNDIEDWERFLNEQGLSDKEGGEAFLEGSSGVMSHQLVDALKRLGGGDKERSIEQIKLLVQREYRLRGSVVPDDQLDVVAEDLYVKMFGA